MSKISDIFHYEGLTYWGPISPERMESILDRMPLAPGLKATDIGCGRGELLIRLAERCGAQVTGVDFSRNALDLARLALSTRAPDVAGRFVKADARAYTSDGAQDLISWLGGPFLGDDLAETLVVLNSWLRPGGHLLIGQGFWASPPPAAYLEATGISEDEMGTHWENIALAEASGLRLLYAEFTIFRQQYRSS